jgi:hypothetical protein
MGTAGQHTGRLCARLSSTTPRPANQRTELPRSAEAIAGQQLIHRIVVSA